MFGLLAAAEDTKRTRADAGSNGEFRSLVAGKGQIEATERGVLHSFVSSAVTASEH